MESSVLNREFVAAPAPALRGRELQRQRRAGSTRSPWRQLGLGLTAALMIAVCGAWLAVFSPTMLGGRATYVFVSGSSMFPRLVNGDFVVMHRQRSYHIGDIVAYHIPKGDLGAGKMVIHRIIGGSPQRGYLMRGDNRHTSDDWSPRPSDIAGKLWLRVPGGARMALLLRPFLLVGFSALLTWMTVMGLLKRTPGDAGDAADEAGAGRRARRRRRRSRASRAGSQPDPGDATR
jgi:signal peptidase